MYGPDYDTHMTAFGRHYYYYYVRNMFYERKRRRKTRCLSPVNYRRLRPINTQRAISQCLIPNGFCCFLVFSRNPHNSSDATTAGKHDTRRWIVLLAVGEMFTTRTHTPSLFARRDQSIRFGKIAIKETGEKSTG